MLLGAPRFLRGSSPNSRHPIKGRKIVRKTIIALFALVAAASGVAASPCIAEEETQQPKGADEKVQELQVAIEKPQEPKVATVGDSFPDVTLPVGLSGGQTVTMDADYFEKSKLTAIVFMNTSCLACRSELELMNAAKNKFGDDFNLVAISIDMNGEKAVEMYTKRFKYHATYLLDPEFTVAPMMGINYTPALIVVGNDGKIKDMKTGYNSKTDKAKVIAMVKDNI